MAMLSERVWWVRQVLEDEGVLGVVDVGECQLDVFPFDTDLLSLELDNSFKVGGRRSTPHNSQSHGQQADGGVPSFLLAAWCAGDVHRGRQHGPHHRGQVPAQAAE